MTAQPNDPVKYCFAISQGRQLNDARRANYASERLNDPPTESENLTNRIVIVACVSE